MSKTYYDHLLDLNKVDKVVRDTAKSEDEKLELWQIVDEIVHHRVMGCVLDHLPVEHHEEFLQKFYEAPYDERLLVYLKDKIKKDIIEIIKEGVVALTLELIDNIVPAKTKIEKKMIQ
jgi:hypothetical protein